MIEQPHTCLLFCTFLVASTPKPLQGVSGDCFSIDLISKRKVPSKKAIKHRIFEKPGGDTITHLIIVITIFLNMLIINKPLPEQQSIGFPATAMSPSIVRSKEK